MVIVTIIVSAALPGIQLIAAEPAGRFGVSHTNGLYNIYHNVHSRRFFIAQAQAGLLASLPNC